MVDAGNSYSHLLSPGRIGRLETRNRILMCPMGDNLARDDGELSDASLDYFEARARGGAGILIVGSVAVSWPEGSYNPNQSALSDDRMIPGFRELARRVHTHGTKLVAQLSHGGLTAVNDIRDGRPLWVPSPPAPASPDPLMSMVTPEEAELQSRPQRAPTARTAIHEMTRDDITWLITRYADAAERAQRAGLDGVEIHAGHGYIISSFLSPAKNKREDTYGGSFENRTRLLVETIEAIRDRVGRDFAVWCRIDSIEFGEPGGITPELAAETARVIEAAGGDAIHASANGRSADALTYTEGHTVHAPAHLLDLAARIKRRVGIPVIAVGRIEPEVGDAAIAEGKIDFVAMGRKLLADPDLPIKLAQGRPEDVRPCMYHYNCIGQIFLREPVRCWNNPATGREAELRTQPVEQSRRILVVGGGPAGLEAARLARLRGHSVALCEASDRLGGRFALAARTYEPNARMLAWLEHQVGKLGVDVRLQTQVDAKDPARVDGGAPDAVLVATGAEWPTPSIPGADAEHVYTVDLLRPIVEGTASLGESVAILGGGRAGVGLADLLLSRGHRVTLLEESGVFAAQMGLPGRWRIVRELERSGARLLANARASEIKRGEIRYVDAEGVESAAKADSVVVAGGARPTPTARAIVGDDGIETHLIGDCAEVGFVRGAMESAARVVAAL